MKDYKEIKQNSVVYSGYVNIYAKMSNGESLNFGKHNAGTSAFMELLVKGIVGTDVSSNMPNKLSIYQGTNPLIGSGVTQSSKTYYLDGDVGKADFSFAIPYNRIRAATSEDLEFRLLNNNNVSLAIASNIESETITSLLPGTTLYVVWTLAISNQSEE